MAVFYDEIPTSPDLFEWIRNQRIFWVATAPLSGEGNVNCSPKGHDTLTIVDSKNAWYQDLTGSGGETISHVTENGRITIMFSAFDGPPRITRLFGRGIVHYRGDPEYEALVPPGTEMPGSRAVIKISIHKVQTSCGFSVPEFEFVKDRDVLNKWAENKEKHTSWDSPADHKEDLRKYWEIKTSTSLDGLPGIGVLRPDPTSPKSLPLSPSSPSSSGCKKPLASSRPPRSIWIFNHIIPLSSVISHLLLILVVGLVMEAGHRELIDLKMIVGLAGASVAWIVGQVVGVDVPAPCCAMGR